MPGVGNHESYYNFTAYFNRYILPRSFPGQTNFYFSFDYGQVHFVHFSSEHPYGFGS
jgi:acid phosphatase type 7